MLEVSASCIFLAASAKKYPYPPILFFPWGKKIDQLTDLGQVSKQGLLFSVINGDAGGGGQLTSLLPRQLAVKRQRWAPAFLRSL